ncbi:MAG TPA: lysylphosphatidylglycerol synthase transmembrane domain-containing protein [Dehalococcoidia bacterium]|nr:lysylphosphatidylglycerol synthase transmembrane domain-containing protein [Dehalococcoidia bacterium]
MNMSMLRSRKLWLGAVGTVLFLGLFFARTDFGDLGHALAHANYWWVIPGIAIWFLAAWFRAIRWRVLLAHLADLSTRSLYPIVIIGYMANNLLPARTGELVRAYVLGERHPVSKMATLGTITVERLLDGFVLVIMLASVGAFVGLDSSLRILVIVTAVVISLGLIVLLWATSQKHRADRLVNLLLRVVPGKFQASARELADAFLEGMRSLQSPTAMASVLAATVIAWLLEATMYYFVGLSFDLGEPFTTYLLVTGAANLAITVPSTSGGVGPFELATRETLTSLGVASGTASAYAIALHGFLLLPVIAAGLICLWAINLSLVRVAKAPASVGGPAALKAAE